MKTNIAPEATASTQPDSYFFPVPTTTETIPVELRKYSLTTTCPLSFKGKQRQIVVDVLRATKQPMTYKEVAVLAAERGLHAVGGVPESCRYHLHNLRLAGYATIQ